MARSCHSNLTDMEQCWEKLESETECTNKLKVNNDEDHCTYGHMLWSFFLNGLKICWCIQEKTHSSVLNPLYSDSFFHPYILEVSICY